MKARIAVALMLIVMAVGIPAFGGTGDTPADPQFFATRAIAFTFDEFTSTPPNDITYYVWQDVGGDSTLVATIPHVDGTLTHSVNVDIAGDPGTVNRIVVWGPDSESGLTDYCERFVALEEHHANGCACRTR